MEKYLRILLFTWMGFLGSCGWYRYTPPTNYAYEYHLNSEEELLKVKVWHHSEDSSQVFVKVPDHPSIQKGNNIVNIEILDSLNILIDSSFFILPQKRLFSQTLAAPLGQNYTLDIQVKSADKKEVFNKQLLVEKKDPINAQSFLWTQAQTQAILFDDYIDFPTKIKVQSNLVNDFDIFLHHHLIDTILPPPPFSEKEISAPKYASSFSASTNPFTLKKAGFYKVKIKATDFEKTTTINAVSNDFPKLTSAEELLEGLRFITNQEEYEKLLNAHDKKKAIDDFWLSKAGSYERGKVLIKEFYGRIEQANHLFTHQKMGWKTDRGLIYIIYGPPDVVHRKNTVEEWHYTSQGNSPDVWFYFDQQPNDSFLLQRSYRYKESWDYMVYGWRNGIISKWR